MGFQANVLFPERLEQMADRHGAKPALIDDQETRSWADFLANARAGARTLSTLLPEPAQTKDRIGVIGANSIPHAEAIAAVLLAGCCLVPLSTFLEPRALGRIIEDADLRAVYVTKAYLPLVTEALTETPKSEIEIIVADERPAGFVSPGVDTALPAISPEWEAVIVYSSGTTGLPKGIVHTHAMRTGQMTAFSDLGFDDSSKTLLSTPLASNWTLAGLLTTLWNGGTTILMKQFDAAQYLSLVQQLQPNFAFLVPTQIERILARPELDELTDTHACTKLSAGSPISGDKKLEFARRWPGELIEIYSQTEGSVTTTLSITQRPDKANSVGQPSPGIEIRIISENGSDLPVGEIGEIVGQSPVMTNGYLNRPDATQALYWTARDGRRFQRTGDLGHLDEDGFLYIAGREKDMIISGGFNVYPADLEGVIGDHPAVIDVAVIGVPSDKWGETPLAVVVADGTVSEEQLADWANSRLGKLQRLAGVQFVDDLPRGSLDKVLKKTLRAQFKDWL